MDLSRNFANSVCMASILLTGSSRGIGVATKALLASRGHRVIGQARKADGEDTIAAELGQPGAAETLWQAAHEQAGGSIDVLINNAGMFEANPLDRDDADWLAAWQETLQVNLTAAAILSRLAVRDWRARGVPGRIVQVASRAGHRGDSPDHWHYAASKGAMLALHKTIARQYAGDGILSFAVAPGFTDTAMAGDYLASRGGAGLLADIPLGRVATPDEIAQVIAFCAIDAPASMTGATLDVNGASYVR